MSMAYFFSNFSSISSGLGKRLLLFGLRKIDVLDKDPADFVNVDLGKQTRLEVRDVGLNVKKLAALLHLQLPPEIELSAAHASVFRITLVLEVGVPNILVEIDSIRIRARLVDNTNTVSKSRGTQRSSPRDRSRRTSSPAAGNTEDDEEGHLPTVDDLAESFIREEPDEDIKELEHELGAQPTELHESMSSSSTSDEGMGAPMALPSFLRTMLNTALDRLQIVVNDIDVEMEDQTASSPDETYDAYTSLNFHVDRVSIDSVTADAPNVNVSTSNVQQEALSKLGKRRLRIENICGRLVSDALSFDSVSIPSAPSSPVGTRSVVSSSIRTQSEAAPDDFGPESAALARSAETISPVLSHVADQLPHTTAPGLPQTPAAAPESPRPQHRLDASTHSMDEDRFADADSDDGSERSIPSNSSRGLAPHDLGASSRLYDDDERTLEELMQNSLPNSQIAHDMWGLDGTGLSHEQRSFHDSQASSANLPTVSILGQSIERTQEDASLGHSTISEPDADAELDHSRPMQRGAPSLVSTQGSSSLAASQMSAPGNMSESGVSNYEDARSVFQSTVSHPAPSQGHVPGSWNSSSSASSNAASSDTSGEIPEEMVTGSIFHRQPNAADSCETPRPNSPQSPVSSPLQAHKTFAAVPDEPDQSPEDSRELMAKVFLTIDEITVWFPLGLGGETTPDVEVSGMDFRSSGIAEDSIFETMPGTFSYYNNEKSARGRPIVDDVAHQRPGRRAAPSQQSKSSAIVSVEVGTVLCHIDFSTGHVMTQMLTKAIAALGPNTDATEPAPSKPKEPLTEAESLSSYEISVKAVCVAWKERLLTEPFTEFSSSRPQLEQDPGDAIVKLAMTSIYGVSQTSAKEVQTKLQIGKFTLSSLDQDIIAFQGTESKSLKHDIELVYEQKQERRVTLVTRPVKVLFDLEKLDEALDSFGGFSGILEMSASNSRANSPVMSAAPPRNRVVHFGDAPPPPPSSISMPKIQVQLGGVSLTLKGRSAAVQLQTTSVKAAIRGNNVRAKIVDAQFSGPYTEAHTGAPLLVKLQDTTLNFLNSPEEVDLENLLEMITPSKDPYENDDDILIDIFLRQRRKGSVLRLDVKSIDMQITDFDRLQAFGALGTEMANLSKLAKYLPEDDRPGILTLANMRNVGVRATVNDRLGDISAQLTNTSIAHVGMPALFALQVGAISAWREKEVLVHEVVKLAEEDRLPMLMMRVLGDEMEPVVKVKLFNFCAEYHVTTVMAALGLSEDGTADDLALGLASSVATVTGATSPATLSRQESVSSSPPAAKTKPLHLDVLLRNCALGLNPRKIPAKGLFVLTDARVLGKQSNRSNYSIDLELRKASFQAIDDTTRLVEKPGPSAPSSNYVGANPQLRELLGQGYVTLSTIAAAKVVVTMTGDGGAQPQKVDVDFKNELFVIESCADSTQTLFAILGGLQPPMPPSTAERYRPTVPLTDMIQSFTMDALAADLGAVPGAGDHDATLIEEEDEAFEEEADLVNDDVPTNIDFVGSFFNQGSLPTEEDMGDSMLEQDDLDALATSPNTRELGAPATLESFEERFEVAPGHEELVFDDNYFKDTDSDDKGKARKWDSSNNKYHPSNAFQEPNAPLKVQVHDTNFIWNLYDGYDWPKTRGELAQAIDDIEARAETRRRQAQDDDEDLGFVEEGQLFNSVWIGVPVNEPKGTLAKQVLHDINDRPDGSDQASETGSYAASTATRSTTATARPGSTISTKRIQKLGRGKYKRISFDLKDVAVDFVMFEPGSGETVSSVDIRIQDVNVYDHIPKSTWNKFAMCDIEPEKREMGRPMANITVLTVKPAPDLAATELVIEVKILPLRLHVDQFALEFIQRFFAFKDESVISNSAPSEQAFIQRLDVHDVLLNLHYKPRKVDYRSLKSGATGELKNFMVLEGTPVVLRHAIVYGLTSFDELHDTLSNIWTPDVIRNQLPQVLSGVALARPIVDVGAAVAGLYTVSMREYRKDGRWARAARKGLGVFARTTTTEVARLGAKVAIGTQNLLEGAEAFLAPDTARPSSSRTQSHDWEDLSGSDVDEPRAVSNYADQPITVRAGLMSAARHFKKDMATARDAIIAIPGEIQAEGTGAGVAKVLARRAPTVVLRPAAGVTKAVSKTLMGVGNALDKGARRKIDDKYKTY